MRQLNRIALGHDRTARAGDQLAAIKMLLEQGTEEAQLTEPLDVYIQDLVHRVENIGYKKGLAAAAAQGQGDAVRECVAEHPVAPELRAVPEAD
jgi:hypothetical protein